MHIFGVFGLPQKSTLMCANEEKFFEFFQKYFFSHFAIASAFLVRNCMQKNFAELL